MSTDVTQETNKNGVDSLKKIIVSWITPRSTDRDEAFREKAIRGTSAIVFILNLLSFISAILVLRSEWEVFSFPTIHIFAMTCLVISAIAVERKHLATAGWFLIITILIGGAGIILFSDQPLLGLIYGVPAGMLATIIAALVLPRRWIMVSSVLSSIVISLSLISITDGSAEFSEITGLQQGVSTLIVLLIAGTLLRQLRLEFDARFEVMNNSIIQIEQAKEQAEEQRQQAEEADRAKTQFLANMSHELRTPLNAIIGYDEAMLSGMVGTFTDKQTQLLGHIQKNSRRLLSLINDILDLSKIESGSLEVYLSPIHVRKVMNETVDSLRSLSGEKGISLDVRIDPAVPEVILSDTKKLEQILVNLISNAIKFTDEGGISVDVDIVDTSTWRFAVKDTGIGIPSDSLEKIFDPFSQVDSSTKRKYKGTGLGLSITKRLVEGMGGEIKVTSEVEKGTTFTVSLPRASIPQPQETPLPEDVQF